MTKGLETLPKKEGIEKNPENPELTEVKRLFEQYEIEMRYLRNFSERALKGGWSSIAGSNISERRRQKRICLDSSSQCVRLNGGDRINLPASACATAHRPSGEEFARVRLVEGT